MEAHRPPPHKNISLIPQAKLADAVNDFPTGFKIVNTVGTPNFRKESTPDLTRSKVRYARMTGTGRSAK